MKIYKIIPKLSFTLLCLVGCSSTDTPTKQETKGREVKAARMKEPPAKQASGPVEEDKVENAEMVAKTQLSAKNQERLQEINQNLAFYCMKHRKDRAFSNEENCLKFTQVALSDCEKKHKLVSSVMVNCIKERLKKRH